MKYLLFIVIMLLLTELASAQATVQFCDDMGGYSASGFPETAICSNGRLFATRLGEVFELESGIYTQKFTRLSCSFTLVSNCGIIREDK